MTQYPVSAIMLRDPSLLVGALIAEGWRVIGPKLDQNAIVYDQLTNGDDLPRGLTDEQEAGHYRMVPGRDGRWFDYVVGPQSWKKWLFPARQKLWSATRRDDGFDIEAQATDWPKTAFIGVRACEIAAMAVQDRVFDNGSFADSAYAVRRRDTLIVAVQCARSGATCFCASMETGPRASAGFDIALTELDDGLFADSGSDRGAAILARLNAHPAQPRQRQEAQEVSARAAAMQVRRMPANAPEVLRAQPDHPQWDEVANRCLSCGNCTLACPTCFCTDVEDVTDLSGNHAERWRSWDSCFSVDFTYVHGGSVRRSVKSRYRQWMTHKLSSWVDQFGTSGCVGCGRCITWCPVGIDITKEVAAIAASGSEG